MLAQFCNFHTVVFAHATLDLVEHGLLSIDGERAFMHAIGGGGGAQRCAERRSVVVEGAGEVTPRAAVWCQCTPTSDYCVGYNVQDAVWVPELLLLLFRTQVIKRTTSGSAQARRGYRRTARRRRIAICIGRSRAWTR